MMSSNTSFVEVGSELVLLRNEALRPTSKLDDQKFEFIFLLDVSGSMGGTPLKLAKEALLLFLHSLPADCFFNVIPFHSTFKPFFTNSVKYSQKNLDIAKTKVGELSQQGYTNLYDPLKHVYSQPRISSYLTQIFTITDGQIDDRESVLTLVASKIKHSRSFSLGIGDDVDRELVIGIAKIAGGVHEFVTHGEIIGCKILKQLKTALEPGLLLPIRIQSESRLVH